MSFVKIPNELRESLSLILEERVKALELFRENKSDLEFILNDEFNKTINERNNLYKFLKDFYVCKISLSDRFENYKTIDKLGDINDPNIQCSLLNININLLIPYFGRPIVVKNSTPIELSIKGSKSQLNIKDTISYLSNKTEDFIDYFKYNNLINEIPEGSLESLYILDPKKTRFNEFINTSFVMFKKHFNESVDKGQIFKQIHKIFDSNYFNDIAKKFISNIDNLKNSYINSIDEMNELNTISPKNLTKIKNSLTWEDVISYYKKFDLNTELCEKLSNSNNEKNLIKKV